MSHSVWLAVKRLRRQPSGYLFTALTLSAMLLLSAAAVDHAIDAVASRSAARVQALTATADIVSPVERTIDGRTITVLNTWREHPQGGGIGVDEMRVSPGVDRALQRSDDAVSSVLPFTSVGILPDEQLLSPDELVAVVHQPWRTRPLEASDSMGRSAPVGSHVAVALVTTLMIVPSLLLVVVCARFDARRQERRTALLLLLGATQQQASRTLVMQALVLVVPAIALAGILFNAARLFMPALSIGGFTFFMSDLRPSLFGWLFCVAALVVLSATGMRLALADASRSPLEVYRSARFTLRPVAVGWHRIVPLLAGVTLLLTATAASRAIAEGLLVAAEITSLILIMIGLFFAGPTMIHAAARKASGSPRVSGGRLVAVRRLQRDPAGGFRGIAALSLTALIFGFVMSFDLAEPPADQAAAEQQPLVELNGHAAQDALDATSSAEMVGKATAIGYSDTALGYAVVAACSEARGTLAFAEGVPCEPGRFYLSSEAAATGQTWQPGDRDDLGSTIGLATYGGHYASGAEHDRGEDLIVVVSASQIDTYSPTEVLLTTAGTGGTSDHLRRILARSVPSARVGTPLELYANPTRAGAVSGLLRMVLTFAVVITGAGLLVGMGEARLQRGTAFAVAQAVGMDARGAWQLTATEVVLPLLVVTIPSLVLGSGTAVTAGTLLGGAVKVPFGDVVVAFAWIVVLGLLTIASLTRSIKGIRPSAYLRADE